MVFTLLCINLNVFQVELPRKDLLDVILEAQEEGGVYISDENVRYRVSLSTYLFV